MFKRIFQGRHQQCGNRVQLEGVDTIAIGGANPLPVDVVSGAAVGGGFDISVTLTISAAGIYVAGDAIGGMITFPDAALVAGGSGVITKIVVIDRDQELAPIDFVFFNQNFTPTADNAPFDPSDADMANCIGYVDVAQTDYRNFNDNSVACKASGLRMPFTYDLATGETSLRGQGVVGSTPTYTAIDDLTVKITVERYA